MEIVDCSRCVSTLVLGAKFGRVLVKKVVFK